MILSEVPCVAAGTYTRNVVKADPVILTKEHLADHKAQGIIFDSGNANACAPKGHENAQRMARVELNIDAIEKGVPALAAALTTDTAEGLLDAAHAILTTDLKVKEIAVTVELGGKTVRLGAIAKGSGMIHPNMGTMLCFLTTDCAIDPGDPPDALLEVVQVTFNRVSVDGDTSTNDMCCVLANGMAGNPHHHRPGPDYDAFLRRSAPCVRV